MTVKAEEAARVMPSDEALTLRIVKILEIRRDLLLPNFSINAHMPPGHCTRVEYTVRMTPAIVHPAGSTTVWVGCWDHKGRDVGRRPFTFAPEGGEQQGIFEWPMPSDSGPWDPDWTGTATVKIIDATGGDVHDRDGSDNQAVVTGTCVG